MILHIDMDAFFASIEQAVNPRLRGRPLIVGSRGSRMHTVVCAASYEAKRLGISSGMPSAEAFRICPQLEFVPAEQSKYIWTSQQILRMLGVYGFQLNYVSIDEFQMDIGSHPEPAFLSRNIQEQIYANFNITASVGVAKNWLLAKLCSKLNKPNGIAILTQGNLEEVLAGVPVDKLCGIGPKSALVLTGLGVNTCLDLYQKSPGFLAQIFGQNGISIYRDLHANERWEPVSGVEKPKSVGHSYTLSRASQNTGFIRAWIRLLSEMVSQRLRQQNLVSKSVHLWLNGPDYGSLGAQKAFQQETDDGFEIYSRSLKILARLAPGMPKIRALGVTCGALQPAQYQPLLKEAEKRGQLLKALDRINNRFGEGSIYPAQVSLTHPAK